MTLIEATQFNDLAGPSYLTKLAMRPDTIPGPSGPLTGTLKIFASTTRQSVAGMSTAMDQNHGTDRMLLFSGEMTWSHANLPGPGDTRQFDSYFPLTTPFYYSPEAGNLVLDLQFSSGGHGVAMRHDAVTSSPVVRKLIGVGSPTATTGVFGSPEVLQLTFEPAPAITIRTSQVELCWDSVPEATYRVEWRTEVAPADWTPLVECVRSAGEATCVQDAVAPAAPRRFYRVVRTDCTP